MWNNLVGIALLIAVALGAISLVIFRYEINHPFNETTYIRYDRWTRTTERCATLYEVTYCGHALTERLGQGHGENK